MPRIVEINGRHWLAGMSWCSFEASPDREELQEDANRLNADWYAVRLGEAAIQGGFCAPVEGQKRPRKLYSLAAMLADSKEQPWLGIFKIEEGLWWYVAVRDHHAILPDGDVIGGEEEIHAIREKHSGYTDWKYIEGDIALLGELIEGIADKPTAVKSLTSRNPLTLPLVGAAALLLTLAIGGYVWYANHAAEEHERAIAMEKMRAQLAASQAPAVLPSPLLTTPTPNDWLAACGQIISNLPISQFGWITGDIACAPAFVEVTWKRPAGATVAHKPAGELLATGDTVIQTLPLVGLEQRGPDNAVALPSAQLVLRAWAQAADLPLVLTAVPPPAALPGATANDAAARPIPVPQAVVKFDSPIWPFSLDFSSVPGLRLSNIKTSVIGWSVEGVLYGSR